MQTAFTPARVAFTTRTHTKRTRTFNPVRAAADRPVWLPGSPPAKHLDGACVRRVPGAAHSVAQHPLKYTGKLPGDYGFDPLGLAASGDFALRYYREAELVHGRWAMLGCAGVLVQELVRPDVRTAQRVSYGFHCSYLHRSFSTLPPSRLSCHSTRLASSRFRSL